MLGEAVIKFLDDMIAPITQCLQLDQDPKVQIAACDAIYNITKCYREEVLKNRQFASIFSNIITLIGTSTQQENSSVSEVRSYAKKVDEKIKDTVFACLSTK
jgi:hypothetical protein